MDRLQVLTERAKALRPAVQTAFDAGGFNAICEQGLNLSASIKSAFTRHQALQLPE
jgi:hypothetical protein